MYTGGRGVRERKSRVDEARSIDILYLQRKGVFSKCLGWSWALSWSRNGVVVAAISYQVESGENGPTGLRLMYTTTDNHTGEKKDYNYIIPLVSTACNYGGVRWWFICPLIVNGRVCHRKCRIIYMSPGAEYFGCRECHQLSYESRQRHREKFYEGFEKPYKTAKDKYEEFGKARSWKKKEKILLKLSRAHAAIQNFDKKYIYR